MRVYNTSATLAAPSDWSGSLSMGAAAAAGPGPHSPMATVVSVDLFLTPWHLLSDFQCTKTFPFLKRS